MAIDIRYKDKLDLVFIKGVPALLTDKHITRTSADELGLYRYGMGYTPESDSIKIQPHITVNHMSDILTLGPLPLISNSEHYPELQLDAHTDIVYTDEEYSVLYFIENYNDFDANDYIIEYKYYTVINNTGDYRYSLTGIDSLELTERASHYAYDYLYEDPELTEDELNAMSANELLEEIQWRVEEISAEEFTKLRKYWDSISNYVSPAKLYGGIKNEL